MDWWLTPSGTTVKLDVGPERRVPNTAAVAFEVGVSSTGGMARNLEIRIDEPNYINALRVAGGKAVIQADKRAEIATIAALKSVDADPNFFEPADNEAVFLGVEEVDELVEPDPISEQALRRYIARRLYLAWREKSFDEFVRFSPVDAALTGAGPDEFLRNLQLLEQEEYVTLDRTMGRGFESISAKATAGLIRAVERYGAAPEDVETQEEYSAALRSIPALAPFEEAVLLERRRYEAARSATEVASAFRATAPVLENVCSTVVARPGLDQRALLSGADDR